MGALAKMLPSESLATWYVFSAIFGLAAIAEGGISKSVTREVAYRSTLSAWQGSEMATLVTAATRFYIVVVVAVCALAIVMGLAWMRVEGHSQPADGNMVGLLVLYAIAGGVSLVSSFLGAITCGRQLVSSVQKNEAVGSIANAVVAIAVLAATASLLAPIVALLVGASLTAALNHRVLSSNVPGAYCTDVGWNIASLFRQTRTIWTGSEKMVLMMVAYHILTSYFRLLVGRFHSQHVLAQYGLTAQAIALAMGFASVWITADFPKMAAAKDARGDELMRILTGAATRGFVLLALSVAGIVVVVPSLLHVIDSRTNLLDSGTLSAFVVMSSCEFMVGVMAQFLISQGRLEVATLSLWGALAIGISATVLFGAGGELAVVLLVRAAIYILVIGVPCLVVSVRQFRR